MEIIQIYLAGKEMVNSFIIKGKDKAVIVDAGNPGCAEKILQALSQNNIAEKSVSLIVITHAHRDHYGGASELQKLLRAPLAVQREGVLFVSNGWIAPIKPQGLPGILALPFTSRGKIDSVVPEISFDRRLNLDDFGVAGKVIATPGHTDCSATLVLDSGECIIGDLLMFKVPFRNIPALPFFAVDMDRCVECLRGLIHEGIKKFYAGHGGPWPVEKVEKILGKPF